MIDSYQFGYIIIDGKTYNHDVWADLSDKVNKWQRKESHIVEKEDLEMAVKEKPEILIIGTGAYGVVEVPKKTKDFLREEGIEVIILITPEAVKEYNNFKKGNKKVVALLHLTC